MTYYGALCYHLQMDMFYDLAVILQRGHDDVEAYREAFEDEWGQLPTVNACLSHRQAVINAQLGTHPILEVAATYAEGGQIRVRGLAMDPNLPYLLKPVSSLRASSGPTLPMSLPGISSSLEIPLLAHDLHADGSATFYEGTCRKVHLNGRTEFEWVEGPVMVWEGLSVPTFDQGLDETDEADEADEGREFWE